MQTSLLFCKPVLLVAVPLASFVFKNTIELQGYRDADVIKKFSVYF